MYNIAMKALIYTDGSSRGNPGSGAYAFLVKTDTNIYEEAKQYDNVTNNQMELSAILKSLEYIKDKNYSDVLIKSDSEYAVKGINVWLAGWKRNGWKTSTKKEVKNQDLWFKIDETINEIQSKNTMLSFEHVLGHNGEKYNERVDQLCTSFATGKPLDLYDGSIEGHNELLG